MTYIIIGIIMLVLIGVSQQKPDYSFNASFIAASSVASSFNKGLSLTGSKHLTRKQSFSNFLVCAQSGAGKSTGIIIPSIFNLGRSGNNTIFCNDPSSEIYNLVSGYLKQQGYKIIRIDFSDIHSTGFNNLQQSQTMSDIQKQAHLILLNTQGDVQGDKFWQTSAEMVITMFGRYLVFHTKPEFRTMANLLRLVETFSVTPEKIDRLIVRTGDEVLINSYRATVAYSDRVLQSIIAVVRASLFVFTDPAIIQTTSSANSIDIGRIRHEPHAIFLCNPIPQLQYLKPISALFIQSLFNEVLSALPTRNMLDVYFILDEIGTVRFNDLGLVVSQCRKYSTSLLLAFQDYQSLVALYGPEQAHNIKTNCFSQVYLPGQPLATCRELSTLLGQFNYEDAKNITRQRPLLSVDELRMTDKAVILTGQNAPVHARMTPFYKHWRYSRYAQIPPYQPASKHIVEPPRIPLD